MPRDVCALSQDLPPGYVTAYTYDGSGSFLQEHVYQQRGHDHGVAINVGRYISADPKGVRKHIEDLFNGALTPDINLFVYAGNIPVTWSDPTGRDYWLEGSGPDNGGYGYHERVCVGNPKDKLRRNCISFAVDTDLNPGCVYNCIGKVYFDITAITAPGPIVSYRYTDRATDDRILADFQSVAWPEDKGLYNIPWIRALSGGSNCRDFAEKIFKYLDDTYHGNTEPPKPQQ